VRYIHLNPLRAGVVDTLAKLDRYKWCGHSVVMNRQKSQLQWQDREYVLKWFGTEEKEAKRAYRAFVKKGIEIGERPDLTGGGLIRSMGGWSVVKAMRKAGEKQKADERILGSSTFVSKVLGQAEEKVKYQLSHLDLEKTVKEEISDLCNQEGVTVKLLQSASRRPPLPQLRKSLARKLVNAYGISLAETARQLGVSTSGVSQMLRRK